MNASWSDRVAALATKLRAPGRTAAPVEAGPAPEIAIIGAGFAGIGMAIRLRMQGIESFTIFEKANRPGGVWRDNTYPGSGCDVPSHLYSYSFERRSDWSRRFPKQPEILDYIEHCVRKYRLTSRLRLGVEITSASWDDTTSRWTLTTATGEQHEFGVVIFGLGQLNRPHWPDIEGLHGFGGTVFHSARWDHGHDLTGDRVAVIGNGASAVQFVPPVAEQASKLYQFQRSPNWLLPKPDKVFSDRVKLAFKRVPLLERAMRSQIYLTFELRFLALRRGSKGGALAARRGLEFLESQVPDAELRARLTPDYPVGCKRILISDDYLATLCRPNVEVVTDAIERVTPTGIVTTDGTERAVDTIVVATGFAATEFLSPIEITGRDGTRLAEVWKGGASAYEGISVAGFPNLFILYGPNTNLGHNSIIFMIEAQIRFVLSCLARLREPGVRWIDVRTEAADRYDDELQQALHGTVWEAGCDSWYKNEAGRVTNNWPKFTVAYWWETRHPRWPDFATGPSPAPAPTPTPT